MSEDQGKAVPGIKLFGDPVLKKKAQAVTVLDRDIHKLIEAMAQSMYAHRGVGLAAPQIGVSKRIIIVDVGEGLLCVINPEIKKASGKAALEEGCLSFPGITIEIKRAEEIVVEGLNHKGEQIRINAKGLVSRALQHEIDHLDGVLIIDRASKKKLKAIKSQLSGIGKKKEPQ